MRVIFLMIVMLIAVSASILVLKFSAEPQPQVVQINTEAQQSAPAPQVQTVDVLVARQEIPIGATVDENMIDRQPWPAHLVLEGFLTVGSPAANGVVGMVTRAPFQAREPLIGSKLANPNDPSFLAAALPEGMRAITIPVDAVSGVAGYIFPGDRVDVLLTHNLPKELSGEQGGFQRPGVTEVLVPNIKVIGINLRGSTAPGQVQAPSSISLEVSESDAQKLRLAEKVGTLSLTLRSLKDGKNVAVANPTMVNELSHASLPRQQASGRGVNIVRGGSGGSAAPASGGAIRPPMPTDGMPGLPGGGL